MNGMIAIMHKQNEPIAIKYFICFLKYSAVEDPARIPAIFPPLFLILFAISSGWSEQFNNVFRYMDGLQIIPGNINDPDLSNIYSNVRGYYYQRVNQIR